MKSRPAFLTDYGLEFDFRNACWGMTKSEVKYSELAPPNSEGEGYITYREQVMDLDAIVGFHFLGGFLVEAGYAFRAPKGHECEYLGEYDRVKRLLANGYGEPRFDENISEAASERDGTWDADEDADADRLMFLSEWLTGRSIIRLILTGESGSYDFGLLYRSREHVPIIQTAQRVGSAC